jgi:F-type H+-transporting ATPase subunit gamma
MSKRREIEEHVRTLGEIENIMGAMKNLALMEMMKLSRVQTAQHQVVNGMEAAGRAVVSWHPDLAPDVSGRDLYLVIGAERGFCGDFNEKILSALDAHLEAAQEQDPALIVVGKKLLERVNRTRRVLSSVEGATVLEEVQPVLTRVIDVVSDVAATRQPGGRVPLTVVYHDAESDEVRIRPVRPFQSVATASAGSSFPPVLTLPPEVFLAQLVDLFLFSLLHAMFYSALLSENRARLAHLESARQRLDQSRGDLLRKRNAFRQEEITEEIEVLMLSVEPLHRQ